MTIPGVGLGFHSDPTKSTQFSPQIDGGNGRNVNYQIDGGDNNDDTVGGLLQLFPLEAIQEFNFVTQRYKAEYGRSNGGVMNIVTKSGTNDPHGSWFTRFATSRLNAKTETEKLGNVARQGQDYRRYQYGGSFGGADRQGQGALLRRVRAHAAGHHAVGEDARAVSRRRTASSRRRSARTSSPARCSANITPTQYLAVRYGRNTNSQVYGAGDPRACRRTGATAPTSSTRST